MDITPAFEVVVRNCSGGAADALITLSFAVPGSNYDDPNETGISEEMVHFSADLQEATCPIVNVIGAPDNVVSARVEGFRVENGEPTASLGAPVHATRFENPQTTTVPLTPELRARILRELTLRNATSPAQAGNCTLIEINRANADNRGPSHLFGTMVNKVICSQKRNTADACPGVHTTPLATSTHAKCGGIELLPEDSRYLLAHTPVLGGSLFDDCCDPAPITRAGRAVAIVQCSMVTIHELIM
ncbi:MAG: hypothetical protein ACE5IK_01450, partial [Acidobacteriota bacterium]